jgi:hypothetical protein
METEGRNLNSQQSRIGAVVGASIQDQTLAKQKSEAQMACGQAACAGERQPEFGFDGALRHIKDGRCVARRGWNGRGIFVFLSKGAAHFSDTDTIPPLIDGIKRALFDQWGGGVVTRTPNISIQSASGSHTHGWAPSQTDLLAEDWYLA